MFVKSEPVAKISGFDINIHMYLYKLFLSLKIKNNKIKIRIINIKLYNKIKYLFYTTMVTH